MEFLYKNIEWLKSVNYDRIKPPQVLDRVRNTPLLKNQFEQTEALKSIQRNKAEKLTKFFLVIARLYYRELPFS